ncbi:MAG: hypothetical protein AB1716_15455 [Planctomycetota bacterium]
MKKGIIALLGLAAALQANANIVLWEGNQNHVEILQDPYYSVKILQPGLFKLQSVTNGQLDVINHITVDASCPAGDIYVYVVRNPDEVGGQQHEPGASNLKEINLTGSAAVGRISEVVITGELGELGMTRGHYLSGDVAGVVHTNIEVAALGTFACQTLRSLTVTGGEGNPIPADLRVRADWPASPAQSETISWPGPCGNLEFFSIGPLGVVQLGGEVASVTVAPGNIEGELRIDGTVQLIMTTGVVGGFLHADTLVNWYGVAPSVLTGAVDIDNLTGTLEFGDGGDVITGAITINDDLPVTGKISTFWGNLAGEIVVHGSVFGTIWAGTNAWGIRPHIAGTVRIEGDLDGHVGALGYLGDPGQQENFAHVQVLGKLGRTWPYAALIAFDDGMAQGHTYVSVDYDGYHPSDHPFGSQSYVRIANDFYYGNAFAARVFETTPCRADMGNSGTPDFDDINPFVAALSDPTGGQMAIGWPGREGSRVFHGDCTCDGILNFLDIDPFVLRITEGCCWEYCGPCPGAGDGLAAEELAGELRAHTRRELYPELLRTAWAAAGGLPDPARRTYWRAVYEHLTR